MSLYKKAPDPGDANTFNPLRTVALANQNPLTGRTKNVLSSGLGLDTINSPPKKHREHSWYKI